jgi:hypothetical protein
VPLTMSTGGQGEGKGEGKGDVVTGAAG